MPTPGSDEPVARLLARGSEYSVIVPDAGEDYIQGMVLEGTVYESAMLEKMAEALSPGDVVVDVGANVGNHTLFLACAVGARVIAVEPDARLADAVRRSAALNGVEDAVEVHACAAGAGEGEAVLREGDPANLGTRSIDRSPEAEGDRVPVRTVDEIVGSRLVAMLKVDVEGFEAHVLDGARRTLRRSQPRLWIECLDEPAYEAAVERLRPLGYRVADVENSSPTVLFVPRSADERQEAGMDAVMRRMYAERSTALALRERLRAGDGEPGEGAEMRADLAEAEADRDAARRRVEELEALVARNREDFRVLRGFVAEAEDRIWNQRDAQSEREAAQERLQEMEDALERLAVEKESALQAVQQTRATLRHVRSSRTFQAGKALREAQSLTGVRRAVPRLISIIRADKKGGQA